jgi:hypothetical protein
VPSQIGVFLAGSRISAAYRPDGRRLTPRYFTSTPAAGTGGGLARRIPPSLPLHSPPLLCLVFGDSASRLGKERLLRLLLAFLPPACLVGTAGAPPKPAWLSDARAPPRPGRRVGLPPAASPGPRLRVGCSSPHPLTSAASHSR